MPEIFFSSSARSIASKSKLLRVKSAKENQFSMMERKGDSWWLCEVKLFRFIFVLWELSFFAFCWSLNHHLINYFSINVLGCFFYLSKTFAFTLANLRSYCFLYHSAQMTLPSIYEFQIIVKNIFVQLNITLHKQN